ncbi:MAG: chloride channel protein, partial [Acidimicrobiia bacterium]
SLMVLALVIGVGAGFGAAALVYALRLVSSSVVRLTELGPPLGRGWLFLVLPAGIWLAWAITAKWAPEAAGHGVPQILASLTLDRGRIPLRVPLLKTIATALTIGVGGSAGREGSIAQIGAGIGSFIGKVTKLEETETRALVAAGAGAGIAATFNAPIAGMFFAMEVILRDVSIRHLHTIAVASVAGAVVSHTLIGDELTFDVSPYSLNDPTQLVLYGVLGLIAVGLAILFIEALDWFTIVPDQWTQWSRPLLMGLGVAALGFVAPEVLGTGQKFIGAVLSQEVSKAWWLFALLAIGKLIATSSTLGGKGSGGIFMPSLFIGAMAGYAFAIVVDPIWSASRLDPGAFALVGMAAVFAGVSRASFTSILIVFEITGDYGLVLPLMLAVAIATVFTSRLHPESAYTAPLVRMGIHTVPSDQVDLLATVTIGDLELGPPITVNPSHTLAKVQGVLRRNRLNGIAVVDTEDRLVGIVSDSDITRLGGASDQLTAADAMTPEPATVSVDLPVSEALERMAVLGVGRLPVVDRRHPDRIEAMFRREDAIAAYHLALGRAARSDDLPHRVATRTSSSTRYLDFEIPPGSAAEYRRIREIPWPDGCIVVSVHRGSQLLVASGDLELRSGDALTVFGDDAARRRLIERLSPHTDTE